MMDVLSDALRVMRLSAAAFFTAEFSSPWALDSPTTHAIVQKLALHTAELVLYAIRRGVIS